MTVYITDDDPAVCATDLADHHVRSKIVDTSRILAAALRRHGIAGPMLPRVTEEEVNGPFAVWAAADWNHFVWLGLYGLALVDEFDFRFSGGDPAMAAIMAAGNIGNLMLDGEPDMPKVWPCLGTEAGYTSDVTVFNAYRKALTDLYRDRDSVSWTNTKPPRWIES